MLQGSMLQGVSNHFGDRKPMKACAPQSPVPKNDVFAPSQLLDNHHCQQLRMYDVVNGDRSSRVWR